MTCKVCTESQGESSSQQGCSHQLKCEVKFKLNIHSRRTAKFVGGMVCNNFFHKTINGAGDLATDLKN